MMMMPKPGDQETIEIMVVAITRRTKNAKIRVAKTQHANLARQEMLSSSAQVGLLSLNSLLENVLSEFGAIYAMTCGNIWQRGKEKI